MTVSTLRPNATAAYGGWGASFMAVAHQVATGSSTDAATYDTSAFNGSNKVGEVLLIATERFGGTLTTAPVVTLAEEADPGTALATATLLSSISDLLYLYRVTVPVGAPANAIVRVVWPDTKTACAITVDYFFYRDPANNGAANFGTPVTQANTTAANSSVTLAALANPDSQAYGCLRRAVNTAPTVGSGFTLLADVGHTTPAGRLSSEHQLNVTTVNWTFASTSRAAIGVEVKAGHARHLNDQDDGTYLSAAASATGTFDLDTVNVGTDTIDSVQVVVRASGDTAGATDDLITVYQRLSGVNDAGNIHTLTGTITNHNGTARTTKPGGGAWTQSDLDALQVKVDFAPGNGTPNGRLYDVSVLVTHTAAGGGTDLVIQGATHAHSAENVSLTQAHVLAVADATHSHTAESLALTQLHQLAIASAAHSHTAENVSVTEVVALVIDDASHGHTANNVSLVVSLNIADASHAHTADSPALSQVHFLAVSDALHGHAADNVTFGVIATLVIADASHAHTAEGVSLLQYTERIGFVVLSAQAVGGLSLSATATGNVSLSASSVGTVAVLVGV